MSIVVNGQPVRVVWRPSDLLGPDSDGQRGRFDRRTGKVQPIRAGVFHRMVGSLEGTTNTTFAPSTDPLLTPGERRVSSHFGIGLWGGELLIVQYVALEDTAYCNGQTDRDRAACRWSTWIAAGRPDPNTMTFSIEHEDNAAAGKYVVVEPIIAASTELVRLLLTGDGRAIRAAGIRCSDTAAAQLGRIVPGTATLVPHSTVAPVTKPHCWNAYGLDKGFPQARYIAALTAPAPAPAPKPPEDPMGLAVRLYATADAAARATAFGTARVKGPGHAIIRARDMALVPATDGLDLGTVQRGSLTAPLEEQRRRPAVAGDRTSVVALNYAGELHVTLLSAVAFTAFPPVVDRSAAALEDARTAALAAVGKAHDAVAAKYTEVVPHG